MAAIYHFQPTPQRSDRGRAERPRPELRVIEGGRSATARRHRAQRRQQQLYFQRRLFVGAIVSVLLISGIGGAHALFGATPARAAIPATYVVKGGDTLWKVAQGLGVEGDVRDAIEVIAAANGGPALQPGQVLVIPESLRS